MKRKRHPSAQIWSRQQTRRRRSPPLPALHTLDDRIPLPALARCCFRSEVSDTFRHRVCQRPRLAVRCAVSIGQAERIGVRRGGRSGRGARRISSHPSRMRPMDRTRAHTAAIATCCVLSLILAVTLALLCGRSPPSSAYLLASSAMSSDSSSSVPLASKSASAVVPCRHRDVLPLLRLFFQDPLIQPALQLPYMPSELLGIIDESAWILEPVYVQGCNRFCSYCNEVVTSAPSSLPKPKCTRRCWTIGTHTADRPRTRTRLRSKPCSRAPESEWVVHTVDGGQDTSARRPARRQVMQTAEKPRGAQQQHAATSVWRMCFFGSRPMQLCAEKASSVGCGRGSVFPLWSFFAH